MKKALTPILICFSILTYAQINDSYYWSGKRKISLVPDSSNWTLIPVKGYSKQSVLSQIKAENAVIDLRSSDGSELIDFTLKTHSKQEVMRLKQKFSLHGEITCKHLVDGTIPIILTGDILLQPKKSIAIERIIDLVRTKAKFRNSTEYNTFVLKVDKIEDAMNIANQIYESGLVDWCHPDFWAEIVKTTVDPLYNQQYYLNQVNNIDINAPEAFAITQGCNNIRVAVIDDGIENHEDINGRVLQGFTARNANGFGAPIANLPPANLLIIGHGQACAGIIGATQDNNLGIGGIAPNSRIIPVNIFSDWFIFTDGFGNQTISFRETTQDLTSNINWAWNQNQGNADIISNSWSFPNTVGPGGVDSDAIRQAIINARTQGRFRNGTARGCIVVFASGNENNNFSGVTFPANTDGVITVGAIDRNGSIWNYSSRGAEMDLVAPTGNVNNAGDVSTTDRMGNNGFDPENYVGTFGGTSAACPQVSGVAALMLSLNPNLSETQVRTILQQTATDMGTVGFDNTFGFGRVNAEAALKRILSDITIAGSNLVCSTQTYTVQNQPGNTTITWSSSNPTGLSINSTTGVATRLNNINSNVTITATINGACGNVPPITKNVWVGNQVINSITIDQVVPTLYANCSLGSLPYIAQPQAHILEVLSSGGGSTTFTLSDPSNTINSFALSPTQYSFTTKRSDLNFTITINANNGCATVSQCIFFSNSNCAAPLYTSITMDGTPLSLPFPDCASNIVRFSAQAHTLQAINTANTSTTFTASGQVSGHALSGTQFSFTPININSIFSIRLSTSNNCGTTTQCIYFTNGESPFLTSLGPSTTSLNIFPNPAANTLQIETVQTLPVVAIQDFSADLINPSGKLVKSGKSANGKLSFDVHDLPTGEYYVHIHSGKEEIKRHVQITEIK
jgi:serine protease